MNYIQERLFPFLLYAVSSRVRETYISAHRVHFFGSAIASARSDTHGFNGSSSLYPPCPRIIHIPRILRDEPEKRRGDPEDPALLAGPREHRDPGVLHSLHEDNL